MAYVFLCQPLPFKDMTEMRAAMRALDFNSHAIRIGQALDRAGDFVVERWPAAMRIEFVARAVQWRVATLADVGSSFLEVFILSTKGHLGPFFENHALLLRGQRIID